MRHGDYTSAATVNKQTASCNTQLEKDSTMPICKLVLSLIQAIQCSQPVPLLGVSMLARAFCYLLQPNWKRFAQASVQMMRGSLSMLLTQAAYHQGRQQFFESACLTIRVERQHQESQKQQRIHCRHAHFRGPTGPAAADEQGSQTRLYQAAFLCFMIDILCKS